MYTGKQCLLRTGTAKRERFGCCLKKGPKHRRVDWCGTLPILGSLKKAQKKSNNSSINRIYQLLHLIRKSTRDGQSTQCLDWTEFRILETHFVLALCGVLILRVSLI